MRLTSGTMFKDFCQSLPMITAVGPPGGFKRFVFAGAGIAVKYLADNELIKDFSGSLLCILYKRLSPSSSLLAQVWPICQCTENKR